MFDQPDDVGGPDRGADREGLPDFDAMLAAAVANWMHTSTLERSPGRTKPPP